MAEEAKREPRAAGRKSDRVYLPRCSLERESRADSPGAWRFSLEEIAARRQAREAARHGFTDLERLAAFLCAQLKEA